ncbi:MAG: hypothetical protein A3D96_02405 [Chlamydiae bacterium RIFCSPHIGHO2_12_FULL_44_59]|nr:MAG: hypothetical protein A2796_05095 [Chlamydiae bacterium RIFCSPHIGHO2_01_FULL_44_39]OGN58532.1 MAG: hypothetical protein A3C42_03720 [Chlamydiae bacterium RIFCSPHIGHO2_02_FULL_45_9]OGN60751.1 MAG: hypothetical protein A3D96_02405 [Chlamydiae bacterium RIFCSPHIGHO2_12_FULL_44_59]OGN67011.1 MAG: hypothetical protein A2978_02635 [Chlamydiae bacterium RIFCSPLOWO2_01_FULL_44_52]OGN67564.1 MAG: hypothetical protein A3I67_03850 [Chlamydiae bacterium RIFCSPLOWO2_02_FULL_45_22]OGN71265.1 MAG: hyp
MNKIPLIINRTDLPEYNPFIVDAVEMPQIGPKHSYDDILNTWGGRGEKLSSGQYGTVYRVKRSHPNEPQRVIKEQCFKRKRQYLHHIPENERKVLENCNTVPHIVQLVDSVTEQKKKMPWRYANLLEDGGTDLYKHYLSPGASPATIQDIIRITKQLLECFQIFHGFWLHGDIKPRNILINEKGHVQVADLGLVANSTGTAEVVHAEAYRPPETWKPQGNRHTGTSGDMWAIGVTIYELMTGELLFPNCTKAARTQVYRDKLGELPPIIIQNNKQTLVPFEEDIRNKWGNNNQQVESLIHLVQKMLKLEPESRITAAAALQDPLFTRYSDDIALKIDCAPPDLPPITMHIEDEADPCNQLTLRLPHSEFCFHLKKSSKPFHIRLTSDNGEEYKGTHHLENNFIVTYTRLPEPTILAYRPQPIIESSPRAASPILPLIPPCEARPNNALL